MALADLIADYLLVWILLAVGLGYLVGSRALRPEPIAAVLSVGMRDFAVAAALVVAASLPAVPTLPAVVFGVVEVMPKTASYFPGIDKYVPGAIVIIGSVVFGSAYAAYLSRLERSGRPALD